MLSAVPRAPKPDPALASALRRLREDRDLTREALAFHAGLTTGSLARIELGQSSPGWDTIRRVAKALGISLVDSPRPSKRSTRGGSDGRAGAVVLAARFNSTVTTVTARTAHDARSDPDAGRGRLSSRCDHALRLDPAIISGLRQGLLTLLAADAETLAGTLVTRDWQAHEVAEPRARMERCWALLDAIGRAGAAAPELDTDQHGATIGEACAAMSRCSKVG